jgi:hypothetical protein
LRLEAVFPDPTNHRHFRTDARKQPIADSPLPENPVADAIRSRHVIFVITGKTAHAFGIDMY